METCSVVLTFESVDKILWCDHSNETSSAVLFHGTISFFIILQTVIWDFFLNFVRWHLVKGLNQLMHLLIGGKAVYCMIHVFCSKKVLIHKGMCHYEEYGFQAV